MDVSLVIRQRIKELGLEQRDLARAAQVTESYISQLLTQKKLPPAPKRTDMYDKLGKLLKLPSSELARLADLQRREQLKRRLGDPPNPLFKEVRALILCKCNPDKETRLRAIFEKQPFGELERFVTQKLLDVVKSVAKQEMKREPWLRRMARLSHHNHEQMRTLVGEFVDTNVFTLSIENGASFLDPLIASWDIDLVTFAMEIVLNRRLAPDHNKKFEFVERAAEQPGDEERGLKEFLLNPSLSGDATGEEIAFLRKLSFKKKRPTALYYYRELQNLRDPLHFRLPHSNNRQRTAALQEGGIARASDPILSRTK